MMLRKLDHKKLDLEVYMCAYLCVRKPEGDHERG